MQDPDQQWILDEWIKYVADPKSKVIEPPHLGTNWASIIQAAEDSNLVSVSKHLPELVRRWDGFLKKAALRLRAKLGVEAHPLLRRAERKDPAVRLTDVAVETQRLIGVPTQAYRA